MSNRNKASSSTTYYPNVFLACGGANTWSELEGKAIPPTLVRVSCVAKSFAYFCDRRIVEPKGKNHSNKKISIFTCQGCSWQVKFVKKKGAMGKDDPWFLGSCGLPDGSTMSHEAGCEPVESLRQGGILRDSLSLREYLMEHRNAEKFAIVEFLRTTENIDVSQMGNGSFYDARRNILSLLEMEQQQQQQQQPKEPPNRPLHQEEEADTAEDLSVQFSLGSILTSSEDYLKGAEAMSVLSSGTTGIPSSWVKTNNEKRVRSSNSVSSAIQPAKQKPRASLSICSRRSQVGQHEDAVPQQVESLEIPEDDSFMEKVCDAIGTVSVVDQSSVSLKSESRSTAISSVSLRERTTVSSLSMSKSVGPSSEGSLALPHKSSTRFKRMSLTSKWSLSDSLSLGSKSRGSSASSVKARFRSTVDKVQAVITSRSPVTNRLDELLDRAMNEEGWILGKTALHDVMSSFVEVMESNRVQQEGTLYQNAICLLSLLYINRSESCPSPAKTIHQIVKAMQIHAESESLQHVGCGALHILATGHSENQTTIAAADGIDVVIQAMRLHEENKNIQKEGCRLLKSVTSMDTKAVLAAASGYEVAVEAVGFHRENEVIQKESFRALRSLFVNYSERIRDASVVRSVLVVMESLRNYAGTPSIVKDGCLLLRELAVANPKYATKISEAETDSTLFSKIMQLHEENPGIQRDCCCILNVITRQPTGQIATRAAPDCIDVVVRAMRLHEHVVEIQKDGCCILNQLSCVVSKFRDEILSANGIETIVRAMGLHEENLAIQLAGCSVLGRLPYSAQTSELSNPIVEVITRAMRHYESNEALQIRGCRALSAAQLRSAPIATTSADAIILAMCRFINNETIQRDGCRALRKLVEHKDNHLVLAGERIVEVAVQAMASRGDNVEIQTDCSFLLSRLLDNVAL